MTASVDVTNGIVVSASVVVCVTAGVLIPTLFTITGLLRDIVRELKRLQPKEPWR